jgi:hypothetical protein
MAVNYQVTPLNVTVTPGQTIAEGFTVVSSGTDPSSLYVAIAAITAINESVYEVNYNDFNVSGATGEAGVTSVGANFNEFVAGGTGVILPDGVDKVRFTDNGVAGQVSMEVYFNPTYIIPVNATSPFEVIIDIDGDATLIPSEPVVVATNTLSNFKIKVKLTDTTPNCRVFSAIPPYAGVYSNLSPNQDAWQISGQNSLGVDQDNLETQVTFSPQSTTQNETPIFGLNIQQMQQSSSGSIGNTPTHAWFWIVPDNGYTISRHNFSLNLVSEVPYINTVAQTNMFIPSGLSVVDNYNANIDVSLSGIYYIYNLANPNNVTGFQDNLISNLNNDYRATGRSNFVVNATYPGNETSVDLNYNSLVNSATTSIYSAIQQILFVDTGGAGLTYPFNFQPTDSQLEDFQNATAGVGTAADYNNNAVLVVLNGLYNYVPGVDAPDLLINIKGSAMISNDEESDEFNFTITDNN